MTVANEPAQRLRWWLAGLAAGVAAGVAPWVLGVIGLVLLVLLLGWATLARPRGVVLSGLLIGVGATWLILWGRAVQGCSGANTPSEGCVGPDLSGWSAIPIALLAVGGLLAVATSLRRPS